MIDWACETQSSDSYIYTYSDTGFLKKMTSLVATNLKFELNIVDV